MHPLSLYIHIPFCASKCPYCDFYSLEGANSALMEQYCTALIRQGETLAPFALGRQVKSIFFGGGTPSLLPGEKIAEILHHLATKFIFAEDIEITTEANPDSANKAWLTAVSKAGVNRVSFGAQSFNNSQLAALGRPHSASDTTKCVAVAQELGMNVSLDLMFALPKEDATGMLHSIKSAVALGVDHISLYGLKVEEDTPFDKVRSSLALPDDDQQAQMYLTAVSALAQHGYEQYEISNFAKNGRQCRHNLTYWQGGEYLGLGTGAYSYFNGVRFGVVRDVEAFVACHDFALSSPIYQDHESIDQAEQKRERIIFGLRLNEGVPTHLLPAHVVAKCVDQGLGKVKEERFSLTPRGMLVCNAVIGEMVEFEN